MKIIKHHVSLACLFSFFIYSGLSADTIYEDLDVLVPERVNYQSILEDVNEVFMPQFITQMMEENAKKKAESSEGNEKKQKKKKEKKKKKVYGISGTFSAKHSLKNSDKAATIGLTWKPDPKDYYYFKVGAKHDFDASQDQFSYSWGAGYDDWHTGTFTTQINHWGGIKPGEGFDSKNSIASIGYKIKSDLLVKMRLSSAITVAKKLKGGSATSLSTSLSWSPHSFWFIKGILVKSSQSDKLKWNYLFGYDDYNPRTFGIEYSNYDGNDLRETNFRKNGKLAITYKWKF